MRINPINTAQYTFKGIMSTNPNTPKEIFGKKQDVIDVVSDAKNIDVWTFKFASGGMFNPQTRYTVLIKDKNAATLKEIKDIPDTKKEMEKLNNRVEDVLVWADAPSNLSALEALLKSEAIGKNPEYGNKVADKLLKAQMSNEAKIWQAKLQML